MKLSVQQIIVRGSRHLFWLFILGALMPPLAKAIEVRGETVSPADISMLPPVCQMILTKWGFHGTVNQRDHPELFEPPEYQMAKGNIHLHHYCWALVAKIRYFRAQRKGERDFRFSQVMGDINYVLKNSSKNWQYFHVLLTDQAEMLKIRGDYPNSLLKIDEALRDKPNYERAYALKSDVYLAMGNNKLAIDTAQEGLEKNPRSKFLRWRLQQLGVKVPPPPEPDANVNKENALGEETNGGSARQANKNDTSDGNNTATLPATVTPDARETGGNAASKPNVPPTADPAEKHQDNPVTDTGSRPKNNPYCRFCP